MAFRCFVSLTEEARLHPGEYSIANAIEHLPGAKLVELGYSGKTATVVIPEKQFGALSNALPFAYVTVDQEAELLHSK